MRLREIFPDFDAIVSEDYEAALTGSDLAIKSAKKMKANAELNKAKDGVVKKQKQLLDLSKEHY